jgi:hypothetical protein
MTLRILGSQVLESLFLCCNNKRVSVLCSKHVRYMKLFVKGWYFRLSVNITTGNS